MGFQRGLLWVSAKSMRCSSVSAFELARAWTSATHLGSLIGLGYGSKFDWTSVTECLMGYQRGFLCWSGRGKSMQN